MPPFVQVKNTATTAVNAVAYRKVILQKLSLDEVTILAASLHLCDSFHVAINHSVKDRQEKIRLLANAIQSNTTIITLTISGDFHAHEQNIWLAAIKLNKTIKKMWLNNLNTATTGDVFAGLITNNSNMTHLHLPDLLPNSVKSITDALIQNKSIVHLQMDNTLIGEEDARAIKFLLKRNNTLKKLTVYNLTKEALVIISQAFKTNYGLTFFDPRSPQNEENSVIINAIRDKLSVEQCAIRKNQINVFRR